MSDISPSRIKTDQSLEEKIAACSSQAEISAILRSAAIDQNIVRPDLYDPNVLLEVEPGTVPKRFAESITDPVTGKKVMFEGPSELDVTRQVNAYMREHFGQPAATTEQPRGVDGRFTAEQGRIDEAEGVEAARQAELRLRLIRNEISPEEFLLQSGAFEKHIERQATAQMTADWKSAAEAFLDSAQGADWPGGDAALQRMGELIQENGLENAADKLEALKQSYALMQREDYEAEVGSKIQDAKSPSEIREALRSNGSGLFDRR